MTAKKSHLLNVSFALALSSLSISFLANAQNLSADSVLKSNLKNIPKIENLNISPKLELKLGENPKEKVIRTFKTIGQITGIEMGDYGHIKFRHEDGSPDSYFCLSNTCDKYLEPNNPKFPQYAMLEIHEVEKFIPESGETQRTRKVDKIQTLDVAPKSHSCTKYSKLPELSEGCEGEGCGQLTYHRNTKPISLLDKPEKGATQTQVLPACSEIKEHKFFTKHNSLGRALVLDPSTVLANTGVLKGHIVPMISSIGEGFVEICVANKTVMAYASTGPSGSGTAEPIVEIIDYPMNEAWLQLSHDSKKYWVSLDASSDATMGYYNFEPQELCVQDHPLGPKIKANQDSIKALLNAELSRQCKKHGSCIRRDPTSDCPLVTDLSASLLPKIQVIGQLKQCAALDVSEKICSPTPNSSSEIRVPTLYFTCTFKSDRKELQDRLQMNFSYSCPSSTKGFDCVGLHHDQ